jgi:hypothetical protein
MIDAIEVDNFDCARSALKASLAEYMAGRAYISNEEIFGKSYKNPNKEEQELKAELTEAKELDLSLVDFVDLLKELNASDSDESEIIDAIEKYYSFARDNSQDNGELVDILIDLADKNEKIKHILANAKKLSAAAKEYAEKKE